MVFMLLYSMGVNKYIIQINMVEPSDLLSEDGSHELLEHRRGVAVPLLHDLANKHSQEGCKGCLGNVPWPDAYLFICLRHIELSSRCTMGNIMSDVVLVWEGCYILHHVVVLFA
jgi:hypothetical protein